ncbi:MAG: arsenate reductase ArsC [Chloroflexota bacterium]
MKPSILFICIGNWTRSQMAETFVHHYAGDRIEAFSAGIQPQPDIHPMTHFVMSEIGEDMAGQHTHHLRDVLVTREGFGYSYVVTMCDDAQERCPPVALARGKHKMHWNFIDPAAVCGSEDEQLAAFRQVRDEVHAQVITWLETVGVRVPVLR